MGGGGGRFALAGRTADGQTLQQHFYSKKVPQNIARRQENAFTWFHEFLVEADRRWLPEPPSAVILVPPQ